MEVPFENASLPGYFVRARNTTASNAAWLLSSACMYRVIRHLNQCRFIDINAHRFILDYIHWEFSHRLDPKRPYGWS
jgi:hypothetical protein